MRHFAREQTEALAVRKLIAGFAEIRVVWSSNTFRVRHALDPAGRPLLLCRAGGVLDTALTANDAVVCRFDSGGDEVWVAGWAAPALDAAQDFAATNPQGDLLDVGRGFGIYRIDVAEVRVRRGGGPIEEIDVDDYMAEFSEPVI
jgi:hypothetical protein